MAEPFTFFLPLSETRGCRTIHDVQARTAEIVAGKIRDMGMLNEDGLTPPFALAWKTCHHPRGYDVTVYLNAQWTPEQLAEDEAVFNSRKQRTIDEMQELLESGRSLCCEALVFQVKGNRPRCWNYHCSACRRFVYMKGPKYL